MPPINLHIFGNDKNYFVSSITPGPRGLSFESRLVNFRYKIEKTINIYKPIFYKSISWWYSGSNSPFDRGVLPLHHRLLLRGWASLFFGAWPTDKNSFFAGWRTWDRVFSTIPTENKLWLLYSSTILIRKRSSAAILNQSRALIAILTFLFFMFIDRLLFYFAIFRYCIFSPPRIQSLFTRECY